MAITGLIYGLDLGVRSGVTEGCPGATPRAYSVELKKSHEAQSVAFSNLIAFLNQRFTASPPQLLVKEAMLPLEAFRQIGNAEKTVRLHAGMHAVVEGMCDRFGVAWRDVRDGTVRKHFIGKARMGTREETKAAIVARCHLLGLMPRDCWDDNRADSIAVHDWACAVFGRRAASMRELYFFNEQPEPRQ